MSFLAPLALIGAAILGPIIIAMYLLKLRREERVVSSTFLWQRMIRDVEANAPWQRLRPNILLLLQLLLLLLLALALARPFFKTQGIAGHNLILIIDRSASMGATDVAPTRLEAAKEQANRLVNQLPDGGRATVIVAGGHMEVPASATTDRRELRNAINAIALRHGGGSDLSQPLALASALAARKEQSEIAIISDGNVTIPADLDVPAPVRYFPIGHSNDNVAISALAMRPSSAGQTLFAQAMNYGDTTMTRRMDVYLDGVLFNAYNLMLEPGQEQSIVAEVPAEVDVVEARLAGEDALPDDDHAWAVSTLHEAVNVRIVGPGNYFLETALELLPGVQVTYVTTETTQEQAAEQVPVTILDRVIPAELPANNVLFIAPPRSTVFFSVTGELEFPTLRPVPGDEPLLRNVSLSEVSVLQAVRIVPGMWARDIIQGDRTPLLVAGETQGQRIAVLAFALHESDLPLQVAFPLLLSNIIGYLAPGSGAEAAQMVPGQPLSLQLDPAITEVRLTRPDEMQLKIRTDSSGGLFAEQQAEGLRIQNGQLVYAETDMLGVYTIEAFKGNTLQLRRRYAVNLFSPNESQVKPEERLEVSQTSGLQSAITRQRDGKQEFWRWLAALALIVLLVEWLVYHKNGIAYLRERLRGKHTKVV